MTASVRIFEAEATEWMKVREATPPEIRAKMSAGELESQARIHHPGTGTSPQLFEVRVPPDTELLPHAHEQDEILYVVSGELRIGQRVLRAGSSLFVGGETLYGFRSGPEGLHFLNFRPRTDLQYLSQDEYHARRAAQRSEERG